LLLDGQELLAVEELLVLGKEYEELQVFHLNVNSILK